MKGVISLFVFSGAHDAAQAAVMAIGFALPGAFPGTFDAFGHRSPEGGFPLAVEAEGARTEEDGEAEEKKQACHDEGKNALNRLIRSGK